MADPPAVQPLPDEHFMDEALKEARKAFQLNEVPVGAVVACNGVIIARAHNLCEQLVDVTAHAEMQVITSAAMHLGGKYLDQCTLYVTLEPCPMCAGALHWAQIKRLVYGARDPKRGFSLVSPHMLHPRTQTTGGIRAPEASDLLKDFFRRKR